MAIVRHLALALIVAGAHWLAAGQNTPNPPNGQNAPGQNAAGQNASGQNPPDASQPDLLYPDPIQPGESTVNRPGSPDGPQPMDSSAAEATAEIRVAPVAAVSGRAGFISAESEEDTNSELPQIPPLLGGRGMTLAFTAEKERSNYLRGGVNVGAAYDDNPLLLSSNAVSNVSGTVFPNLRIEETTSRTRWELGYAGGLTVNQRFTNQNQGSHDLSFDSQYRLSPHVNLRVAENFLMTTGVFDAGAGGLGQGEAGTPNASILAPLAQQKSSLTTVETNYHYALNDLVGAGGSFYDLRYGNVAEQSSVQLTNEQMASGVGFWLHRFFPGNWGGASYRFQRITYGSNGEARVHDWMAVDEMKLTSHVSLNGFIGPEYTMTQETESGTATTQANQWSVTGGAAVSWQDVRTTLTAGYSRTTSDGGGVLGAVRLQTVHGSVRRQLVRGWSGDAAANRGTNDSLTVPYAGGISSVNLTSAGGGLERTVRKGLELRFSYNHDFQRELTVSGTAGVSPAWSNASRNRVAVMLSYQWAKPLGM
jgi:hypothetical protein